MTFMFEVYYKPPPDPARESALTQRVAAFGGHLDCREVPDDREIGGICLTYEFDDEELASNAASLLRGLGEHVEGPVDYAE
ncbi:MAG: hypothetical protein WD066_08875 [Planctomycetaceae bacterium]